MVNVEGEKAEGGVAVLDRWPENVTSERVTLE